jgi:hypothetical protein
LKDILAPQIKGFKYIFLNFKPKNMSEEYIGPNTFLKNTLKDTTGKFLGKKQ